MKNRILTFIIGLLTGAIIMTLIIQIVYKPINRPNENRTNFPENINEVKPPRY